MKSMIYEKRKKYDGIKDEGIYETASAQKIGKR